MNKNLKPQILKLKSEGKTYNQIQTELGCSKGTISYHLGAGQKEKANLRALKNSKINPSSHKISTFHQLDSSSKHRMHTKLNRYHSEDGKNHKGLYLTRTFSIEDLVSKFGNTCYLTGRTVDIQDSKTYELDHIIPKYLGGTSTFENCGLASRNANRAKADMELEEFFKLCVDVVRHNKLKIE